jgi:microcompartment protein CcmL/EutN
MDRPEALAIVEIGGWSPAMVVLDAMEKTANVRVLQTELNDAPGVCIKLAGRIGDIQSAARAAEQTAQAMQVPILAHVIPQPAEGSRAAWEAAPDFNPLIEQPSVQRPENTMNEQASFAVGLIETQGFTAAFEAIDTLPRCAPRWTRARRMWKDSASSSPHTSSPAPARACSRCCPSNPR